MRVAREYGGSTAFLYAVERPVGGHAPEPDVPELPRKHPISRRGGAMRGQADAGEEDR